MYEVSFYETENGRVPVVEYMERLTKQGKTKELAQIMSYVSRLEKYGLAVNITYPDTIRKLQGDVWELKPGNNRVFFFYFTGDKFILLHAYRKFKMKAPQKEIDQANKEMNDHIRRHKR